MSHGEGSTFLAEILALELGLKHGWELGLQSIVCYTDSPNVASVLQSNTTVGFFWAREEIPRVMRSMQWDWQVMIMLIS